MCAKEERQGLVVDHPILSQDSVTSSLACIFRVLVVFAVSSPTPQGNFMWSPLDLPPRLLLCCLHGSFPISFFIPLAGWTNQNNYIFFLRNGRINHNHHHVYLHGQCEWVINIPHDSLGLVGLVYKASINSSLCILIPHAHYCFAGRVMVSLSFHFLVTIKQDLAGPAFCCGVLSM